MKRVFKLGQKGQRGPKVVPLIPIPDQADCGPAMAALNPAQRGFVIGKVLSGLNNTEAARVAGYSDRSDNSLNVTGHRLAQDPRIQDAILEVGRQLMRSEGAKSIHVLVEIRDDEEADAKDRIKCAVELLNRGGLHAVSEHHMSVEHRLSDAEADRRMLAFAAELGLSPDEARKTLIAPADMQKNAEGVYELAPEPGPARELTEDEQRRRERDNELRRHRRRLTPEQLAEHRVAMRAQQVERQRREYADAQAADFTGLEDLVRDGGEPETQTEGTPRDN